MHHEGMSMKHFYIMINFIRFNLFGKCTFHIFLVFSIFYVI